MIRQHKKLFRGWICVAHPLVEHVRCPRTTVEWCPDCYQSCPDCGGQKTEQPQASVRMSRTRAARIQ